MTPPKFSVLLPTHNRADVLGFAIQSVLAQDEIDFELLIVADGCTDDTAEVVAGFDDPRIRFFDLPKAPYFGYANRNVALREARGRLIAFAAHDDLWLPDHLSLMGRLMDETGADWGHSQPLWVTTDGIVVPLFTNLENADEYAQFMSAGNSIPAAAIVHTREALERAGYWPEDLPFAADWDLWRRMLAASAKGPVHLRQPTVLHFSAVWKKSRFAAMPSVKVLAGLAEHAAWWPEALRYEVRGALEQAVIWQAMRDGGDAFVSELRQGAADVVAHLALIAARPSGLGGLRSSWLWRRLRPPVRAVRRQIRRLTERRGGGHR